MENLIFEAIKRKIRLQICYDGIEQEVEPYRYGKSRYGHYLLRAYLLPLPHWGNQLEGWKVFDIQRIEHLSLTESCFALPRSGFTPKQDERISQIIFEIAS